LNIYKLSLNITFIELFTKLKNLKIFLKNKLNPSENKHQGIKLFIIIFKLTLSILKLNLMKKKMMKVKKNRNNNLITDIIILV
jgi:hypothetical protein